MASLYKEGKTKPFETDKTYLFKNTPFKHHNLTEPDSIVLDPDDFLWNRIHYRNKLEVKNPADTYIHLRVSDDGGVELVLMDGDGAAIKSLRRKVTPYRDFLCLKPKIFFFNHYVVINGFASEVAAITLTKDEDLMLIWAGSGGVFLVLFPFGGTTFGDSFEYRKFEVQAGLQ